MLLDDLGAEVPLTGPPRRVVSLVPSLTEAVAVTAPDLLVGATDWCSHPAGLEVERVRGTKNPDRLAVAELRPDVVLANQEENREIDVRRLRNAGIPVWVSVIETVEQALSSMTRMFDEVLQVGAPAWLGQVREAMAPRGVTTRVVVPIWRDPWMVVGSRTFTGDLLARLGAENAVTEPRYPHVGLTDIDRDDVDVVLLPDEPYRFTADDGPEAFTRPTRLVSGRLLTWYGPSLLEAARELRFP